MNSAVIIMNLGTPVAPTTGAVRAFLKEFLCDRRVVEVPRPVWLGLLYGIILPLRTPRVAKAYASIWTDGESPLRSITVAQAEALQTLLRERLGDSAPVVRFAMSYAGPDLPSVISGLENEGIDRFVVLPLYPQYSATTTGSIFDCVARLFLTRRNIPSISVIKDYFDHPAYIQALAHSVDSYWQQHGRPECLLMSFHGIPQRNVDLGDPYLEQCRITAKRLSQALGLKDEQWVLSFQSRFGRAKWISPYTVEVTRDLAHKGVKHVDVICPAFAADCLETLEEMAVENRREFVEAGGENYRLIPCLNTQKDHIAMMVELVECYFP